MQQTVLVIEDNALVRRLIAETLAPACRVLSVGDGAAGLAAARARRPDLILLDVDLPDLDGFSVCRRLKAEAATRATPVLLLTGRDSDQDRRRGAEAGADDYLTKPFSPVALLARVAARLGAAVPAGDGRA